MEEACIETSRSLVFDLDVVNFDIDLDFDFAFLIHCFHVFPIMANAGFGRGEGVMIGDALGARDANFFACSAGE